MRNKVLTALIVIATSTSLSAQKKAIELFNGKDLKGWETYIGTRNDEGEKYGLNHDPENVFSVVDLNGEKLLRISGEINGSLATKAEYENYHLQLVFKWGEKVTKTRNSGLLYHSFGNYGEGLGIWMSAHELQLWTGHIGDSYRMGNSYAEIPATESADGKTFTYSHRGAMTKFGEGFTSKICNRSLDNELPVGEWNVIDLFCYGTTSVHVVNGKVNMINYNSSKIVNDNTLPLSKGKIQLQSEGGELFIRKISIKKIDKIPLELFN